MWTLLNFINNKFEIWPINESIRSNVTIYNMYLLPFCFLRNKNLKRFMARQNCVIRHKNYTIVLMYMKELTKDSQFSNRAHVSLTIIVPAKKSDSIAFHCPYTYRVNPAWWSCENWIGTLDIIYELTILPSTIQFCVR